MSTRSSSSESSDRLPREILKWIQSLDLAYSVKKARRYVSTSRKKKTLRKKKKKKHPLFSHNRDFSNGFLIAEIFSRYDPHQVEMHSFDNGSSTKSKRANWKHLQKHFRRRSFAITDEELEGLILSRSGHIVPFLCRCYNHLTGRTCKLPPLRPERPPSPTFMKSTASYKVRQTLKSESEDVTDRRLLEAKAQKVLDEHNEELGSTRGMSGTGGGYLNMRQPKVLRGMSSRTHTRTHTHTKQKKNILTHKRA
jgi:hypothetical protein